MIIKYSTDNSAFEDYLIREHDQIFKRIIVELATGEQSGNIYDTNGNKIGEWSL